MNETNHAVGCTCQNRITTPVLNRREFLSRSANGMGLLGLAALLADERLLLPSADAAVASPLAPRKPHFAAKAKHVVQIFAQGAPSHVDTWDPKPALKQNDGKEITGGVALGSPFKFTKRGKSGIEVSEVFENIGQHIDDMAIIRSCWTDIPAHDVASVMMNTGSLRLAKPSIGSWALYGLGTENQNIPGFISLRAGGNPDPANWRAAFLPGVYQGTSINTQEKSLEKMLPNIHNTYMNAGEQRQQLDFVHALSELQDRRARSNAQIEARIEAYEMAFKMQTEATDAFDLSKEPENVRAMYGDTATGRQLLLARRLIERGVRFVQVWHGGWDHHQDIADALPRRAAEIDKPLAAFMKDLKQRGLFDKTLVMWGGEFGRKPTRDRNGLAGNPGRDHHARAFSTWLAGGGVKGGTVYGATDEFGYEGVENKVHIHDLHATILALLGFDHTKLTYRFNGRDFRLTDNFGKVVKQVIA
ncbi:MAG: DUF1501 domain-containing protein [Verrucomicrobia bacterium]|nr:DUF1501 domain-containing protein [Verrucomicrobiota bacterium]